MSASRNGSSPVLLVAVAVFVVAIGAIAWLLLSSEDGSSDNTGVLTANERDFEVGVDMAPATERRPAVENLAPEVQAPAQQAQPLAPALFTHSGSLEGVAVDEAGQAVPDVALTVYKGNPNISGAFTALSQLIDGVTAMTDAEGRFFLSQVPIGQPYVVVGEHPDFARSESLGVRIRKDQTTKGVTLRMLAGAIISGTIVDRDSGNAIAGARAEIYDTLNMARIQAEDRRPWMVVFSDNQGRFAFPHVSQKSIRVQVSADDYETKSKGVQAQFEAKMRDRHLSFKLGPGFSLTGRVVTAKGAQGIADARVQATALTKEFQGESVAFADRGGYFELRGLGEHPYQLRATADGFSHKTVPKISYQDTDLVIELEQQGAVEGIVTRLDGTPLTRFGLYLMRAAQNRGATYLGDNRPFQSSDGTFLFDKLDPGQYVLEARSKGLADTQSPPFEVTREGPPPYVTIALGRGGTIGGTVRNGMGQPLPGATVKLNDNNQIDNAIARIFSQLAPEGKTERQTQTDKNGKWEMTNIPPNTYQVEVAHGEWAPRRANDVLVMDDDLGNNAPVDITLPTGAVIAGTAMDETGKILAFCRVQVSRDGGFMKTTTTDNEGSFRFDNLAEGVYKISLNPERDSNGVTLNPITMLVYSQKSSQEVALREGQVVDDLTLYLRRS